MSNRPTLFVKLALAKVRNEKSASSRGQVLSSLKPIVYICYICVVCEC